MIEARALAAELAEQRLAEQRLAEQRWSADRPARVASAPRRFGFGGVAFELSLAPGLRWRLTDELRAFSGADDEGPHAGVVRACVRAAPRARGPVTDRTIGWRWTGDDCEVSASALSARLRHVQAKRYAATALVPMDAWGTHSLLNGLSAAVVDRAGGLLVHAATVTLDGQALLFIGHTGAGKTTAANLCAGARWLGHDRAVLYPHRGAWFVSGLPGGEACALPRDARRVRPLGGIFAIAHGSRPELEDLSVARAAAVLRQSVQAPAGAAEVELLGRVAALAASGRVRRLHTALGAPLTELLTGALAR